MLSLFFIIKRIPILIQKRHFWIKKAHRMPKNAPYAKTKKNIKNLTPYIFKFFFSNSFKKEMKSVAYTVVYVCPFEIRHRKSKMAAN